MKVGRKSKPTALKLLQGNPGKRPLNPDEPKPEVVETLDCPAFFDDARRKVWSDICKILADVKMLAISDCFPLERYVDSLVLWRELAAQLQIVSDFTERKPLLLHYRQLSQILLRIETEFGLTPSSRSGLTAASKTGGGSGGKSSDEYGLDDDE